MSFTSAINGVSKRLGIATYDSGTQRKIHITRSTSDIKTPKDPKEKSTHPPHLPELSIPFYHLVPPTFTTSQLSEMSYNGQNLNSTGSAGFSDNSNFRRGNSDVTDDFSDIFNTGNDTGLDLQNHQHAGPSVPSNLWYLRVPQVGGPSQLHAGPEVAGGPNGLSHLNDPTTAPVSLYPGNQVSLDEGKSCFMS